MKLGLQKNEKVNREDYIHTMLKSLDCMWDERGMKKKNLKEKKTQQHKQEHIIKK